MACDQPQAGNEHAALLRRLLLDALNTAHQLTQALRREQAAPDPWTDLLAEYLRSRTGPREPQDGFFPTAELYHHALHLSGARIARNTGPGDVKIARCMAALGFERYRETTGQRRRGFRRCLAVPDAVQAAAWRDRSQSEKSENLQFTVV